LWKGRLLEGAAEGRGLKNIYIMGGDHGHGVPKLPDYRKYKVEDCPQLLRNQRLLAELGLKDPWARNEVWKFELPNRAGPWKILWETAGRGFKTGVALGALTGIVGYLWDQQHGHGHGHGDDHGHH
jgi:NADH dehydrogenase (ubiquinone) 1 beta subcomplex subunit 3